MLYVSNFFFSSSTTCHSAFYKVLLLPYPTRTVIIFTKIQLTRALPTSGPLHTTFDQYPKRTDSTNYVSTTKHFEHKTARCWMFCADGNSGSPELSILNFSLEGEVEGFLLEILKVFWTCDWCSFVRKCFSLINFDLPGPAAKYKSQCGFFCFVFFIPCFCLISELIHVGPAMYLSITEKVKTGYSVSHSLTSLGLSFCRKTSCSIPCYCTHGIPLRCVICLEAMQREWDPCIMIQKRGIGGKTMRRMDCGCCVGSAETTEGC